MTRLRSRAFALLAVTTVMPAVYGGDDPSAFADPAQPHEPRVQVRLIADKAAVVPGQPFNLGLHFTIQPGWHLYWNGQNDTGQAPEFTIDPPGGYTLQDTRWPAPMRHLAPGDILDYIYEDGVTLIIPVHTTSATPTGEVTFSMDVNWLVCKDVCIPESGTVSLTLPVQPAGPAPAASADARHFEHAEKTMPAAWPKGSYAWHDRELKITSPAGSRIEFYPGPKSSRLLDPITSGTNAAGSLHLRFEAPKNEPARAAGIVAVWPASGSKVQYYEIDTTAGAKSDKPVSDSSRSAPASR